MKHVCQPVDIRAVKLYNVKKKEVRKMKVLVVSDVHANIAALNTILEKRLITIFCAVPGIIQTMESIRRK